MRLLFFTVLTTFALSAHTAEPMPAEPVQVQCGAGQVTVTANHARLVDVLEPLSKCLGFTLTGTANIATAEMRHAEVSGTPGEVLSTLLEGINALIVGNEQRIERVILLSADKGFIPPTEAPAGGRHAQPPTSVSGLPRDVPAAPDAKSRGIAIDSEPADNTAHAPSAPTIADAMERRALAAAEPTSAEPISADNGKAPGAPASTDPQDYLPELTRRSQEQLKALLDALNQAGDPAAKSEQ